MIARSGCVERSVDVVAVEEQAAPGPACGATAVTMAEASCVVAGKGLTIRRMAAWAVVAPAASVPSVHWIVPAPATPPAESTTATRSVGS